MRKKLVKYAPLAIIASLTLVLPQAAGARTIDTTFHASNFSDPLDIDNPYFPLVAGTTQVFRAESKKEGCELNRTEITNDTKVILGIATRVVHDVVYEDAECDGTLTKVEDTLDFYAQDDAGNVWYMGETSKDCEDGSCTLNEGSWLAGEDIFDTGQNAVPGIVMLADPHRGDRYRQEYYPGHAEDEALVTGIGLKVTLTFTDALEPGTFTHCIKTKEWSKLEPGHIEFKYYCAGIGNVAVDELHGGTIRTERIDPTASALRFRTVRQ